MIGANVRCKFAQLVSNHVFGYRDIYVVFAVVYLELLVNKIW